MASSDADAYDDDVQEDVEETELPPPKRLKVGDSTASSAIVAEPDPEPDPLEGIDVSSDSSGDIPSSPINVRLEEDDFQEQVTVCAWEGCKAGDLGNMDKLVEHIHNDHIEGRQKKYTCEWIGCNRKSMPHASGYALKAHMRSHTREKPFYCYLPGMLSLLSQNNGDVSNVYYRVRSRFHAFRCPCEAHEDRPRDRGVAAVRPRAEEHAVRRRTSWQVCEA